MNYSRELLLKMMPISKHDTDVAEELVGLGYPIVEPILPEILEWLQDANWPVALVFEPFLSEIGPPLVPFVRPILDGDDTQWIWFVIGLIRKSTPLAKLLRADLDRLASYSGSNEDWQAVAEEATEVLHLLDSAV